VRMKIYTVSGRLIRTLFDPNPHPVNYREVIWDGLDEDGNPIANGVYFCRIRAVKGERTIEKTMKLAKVR
jgi:flagellar hook assembly protein FlgD